MPREEPVITATFPSRSNSFTMSPPATHTAMAVPFVANLRLILVVCVLALGINAAAADAPPMPPEATSQHRIGDLAYTAKSAVIEVKREKTARFFHIAYTLDGANPAERPVSFVFNGGPGAASVYLHLGALGPKVVEAG